MRRKRSYILVVDSKRRSFNKICEMLPEEDNYDINFAFSSEDGINKIEKNKPDIVLLETTLPNIETICQKLDKKNDIHVVLFGTGKKHSCELCTDKTDFIIKPVNEIFRNKLVSIIECVKNKQKLKKAEGTLVCAKKIIDDKESQLTVYSERMERIAAFLRALNTQELDSILDAFESHIAKIATIDYFSLFAFSDIHRIVPEMLLHNQTRLSRKPFIDPMDEQRIMGEVIGIEDKVILTPFTHSSLYQKFKKKLDSNYIASFPIIFNKRLVGILNFTGKLMIFGADFASISIVCEALACPLYNAMRYRDTKNKYMGRAALRVQ